MTEDNQDMSRNSLNGGQGWEALLAEAHAEPEGLDFVEERLENRIGLTKRKKRRKRAIYSSLSTVAAALVFIFLVNTNAAFAHTLSRIPVIGQLIEYIQFDKSLSRAIDNKYIQEVDLTAWDGDKRLGLPYVLADAKNLVLFFQLPDDFELGADQWAHIHLKEMREGRTGEKLEGFAYTTSGLPQNGLQENHGFIMQRYHFSEGELPEQISFEVLLELETLPHEKSDAPVGEFSDDVNEHQMKEIGSFTFEVKFKKFAEPLVSEFHEQLSIRGQSITLEEMRVYPTGTEVSFAFADENTAWVKGLDLTVEEGESVLKGSQGISAIYKEDYSGMTVFIESNYFDKPQEQELLIRGMRLLAKEEEFITVDLETQAITPAIEGMELKEVSKGERKANLVFATKVMGEEAFGAFAFDYQDEQGNTYTLKNMGTSSSQNSWMETHITVDYPKSGRIILQRVSAPLLTLEEPIRIPLPQR
ncbi:DUF4179 domain-containing protein [Desulfitobacterium chlororespirans]|uniref:PI-PLC Y-box domain-containing protein n=1 Tax=Desulfitobacterium chlororespirans DSM 11544 TaxID=1121395 RepID=A0A1M7TXW7_9FIRM|nr:DUF4179 domain-containing protein [Desulfitobacterium chlororespirans]SHN75527.1 protein of unknown function [Desulfitobacterium chlororespirans DSM 11544]